ncbi:hypothetical protein BC835DRAFT_594397 [Cytidiella melzeri]|nr:hypothetical protein BC835DRAFT_594397 [Cytidiella melzeri]
MPSGRLNVGSLGVRVACDIMKATLAVSLASGCRRLVLLSGHLMALGTDFRQFNALATSLAVIADNNRTLQDTNSNHHLKAFDVEIQW